MGEITGKSPAEQAQEIVYYLNALKGFRLSEVDEINHALGVAEAAVSYWKAANHNSIASNPTGGTALAVLSSVHTQASGLYYSAPTNLLAVQRFSTSADTYGVVTISMHHAIPVPDFDPGAIFEIVERPSRDEDYARKFEAYDEELGKLYRQILQIMSRTTSYPEKSVLPDTRQAFDYLLDKLVPDENEVRKQSWWPHECSNNNDPSAVTRCQRLKYAVENHVHDLALHETLSASGRHILAVHSKLSGLFHTRQALNTEEAHAAYRDMLSYLNLWADALGLT